MPDTATAPAPPTTLSPATAPPAQAGTAPPSTGAVHLDKPIEPMAPPKPGSARHAVFEGLRKRAGIEPETEPAKKDGKQDATAKPPTDPKAATPPPKAGEKPNAELAAKPTEEGKPGEKSGKASPWKLVDQFKARAVEAESKLAELQRYFPDPKTAETTHQRFSEIEKRNAELEDEIRYVNYTKSKDFTEQYQKPYEQAWDRAMRNLSEIPVDMGNGQFRNLNAEDMLQLVNLPLTQADEIAEQKFGRYAKHVMDERKEIRRLWEAQSEALKNAKAKAAERENQLKQHWQKQTQELQGTLSKLWADSNKEIAEHPEYGQYFKPTEGDEESKTSLEKGYKLVDEALAVNALDPRLTPEQRAIAVKRQAVIRHRAAAFGNMARQVKAAKARIAELEKELAQYKSSEPDTEGRKTAATAGPASAREQVMQAFRSKAR